MRGVFVSGTDTGAGKTVLCAALLSAFPRARYVKPVQTGWPADDDRAEVLRLAQAPPGRAPACGARLAAPVSPHHAAHLQGVRLSCAALEAEVRGLYDGLPLVVEGAGGLLVPLSDRELQSDLIGRLGLPVVLAVGVRLGAINATLLTLEALARRGIALAGAVLVGPDDPSLASALSAFAPGAGIGRLPRLVPLTPASLTAAAAPLAQVPALRAALGEAPA